MGPPRVVVSVGVVMMGGLWVNCGLVGLRDAGLLSYRRDAGVQRGWAIRR